ncbi:MAG: hypothetical protein ACQETI_03715 [Halobacteriota archaeon]
MGDEVAVVDTEPLEAAAVAVQQYYLKHTSGSGDRMSEPPEDRMLL